MVKISCKRSFLTLFLGLTIVISAGCLFQSPPERSSLDQIHDHGRIIMITQNSQNTYYIYREQPFGFEYELAAEFAKYLGVDLAVVTPGWIEMFDMLDQGRGDFVAAGVTVIPSRERRMDFSDPYLTVRQEVVVHRGNRNVDSVEKLNGKAVHVRAGTSYQETLAGLLGKGVEMELVLLPNISTEELIEKVGKKEIEITVADSNIALLNKVYEPDIRIAFPLTPPQPLAWAVKKGDVALLEAINGFLSTIRVDGTLDDLYSRYFDEHDHLNQTDIRAFHRVIDAHLPHYRVMIKNAARKHGFDWRLIAAMIYQESHFNPNARSYTGVRGLMQVTQVTAEEMGIGDRTDPEQSIRAGVGYLANLYKRFEDIKDVDDRLMFTLASYNVGYNHVRDVQTILLQRGQDSESWPSVRETLPLLRMPEVYRETRFGYARGTEPVRYVDNILTYYDILKTKI